MLVKFQKHKKLQDRDMFLLLAACGHLMWKLEDLQETAIYKKKIKFHARELYKELEKQEAVICNYDTNTEDYDAAMEQMHQSYEYFESWFKMILDVPDKSKENFTKAVMLVGRHFEGHQLEPHERNLMQMIESVVSK